MSGADKHSPSGQMQSPRVLSSLRVRVQSCLVRQSTADSLSGFAAPLLGSAESLC